MQYIQNFFGIISKQWQKTLKGVLKFSDKVSEPNQEYNYVVRT